MNISTTWRIILACLAFSFAFLIAQSFEDIVRSIAIGCGFIGALAAMWIFDESEKRSNPDPQTIMFGGIMGFVVAGIAGFAVATRAMIVLDVLFLAAGTCACGLLGDKFAHLLRFGFVGEWPNEEISWPAIALKSILFLFSLIIFMHSHPFPPIESVQLAFHQDAVFDIFAHGQLQQLQDHVGGMNSTMMLDALRALFPTSFFLWALMELFRNRRSSWQYG